MTLILILCGAGPARADLFSPGELAKPHAHLEGLSNCTRCHPQGQKLSREKCLECHSELAGRIATGAGLHGRVPALTQDCQSCHHDHQGRDFSMVDWGEGGQKRFDHGRTGYRLAGKHAQVACDRCHDPRLVFEGPVLELLRTRPKSLLGAPTECVACHFDEHRDQVGSECQSCHDESAWKPAKGFVHDKSSGYALAGKHRQVKCAQCHPTEKDEDAPANAFPAPRSVDFLRLSPLNHQRCLDCHEEAHRPSLGERCQSCHTVQGWRIIGSGPKDPAFHEKTRYPLRGEHIDVPCQSCHGPFPGQVARYRNLPFAACTDCHPDGHQGQLANSKPAAPRCESCHSVEGFVPARYNEQAHAKTGYPLEGPHRSAPCSGCHVPDPTLEARTPVAIRKLLRARKRPENFSQASFDLPKAIAGQCESCHRNPHGKQLSTKGGCRACHAVSRWDEVKFDHDQDSRYPLTGKHAQTACAACHPVQTVRGTRVTRYAPLPQTCASCHTDVHAGQFAPARREPTDCQRCHGTEGWKPSSFRHLPPFTSYLLEGAHAQKPCEACHPKVQVAAGVTATRYKPLPRACAGCHSDFHQGRFLAFADWVAKPSQESDAPRTASSNCQGCHTVESFSEGIVFPHDSTGFVLEGGHVQVACRSCHPSGYTEPAPRTCAGCHRDPHGSALGGRCESCHEQRDWKSAFGPDDHRRTSFPLTGRHAAVPCQTCHGNRRDLSFARVSSECLSCHQADQARTAASAVDHSGLGFSTACQQCHDTARFTGAAFPEHDDCFLLSKGPHRGQRCTSCHTSALTSRTGTCATGSFQCTGCHVHSQEKTQAQHLELPGYQYKDGKCYDCHRLTASP